MVDGYIQTDVSSKPTDSHLYLKPSSAHPKHVFKAIPYGVATRLKGNCSTFQSFKIGWTYFIKSDFQCTSSSVVYLVSCKRCHLRYVGSTKTEFKLRFRNHKSAMRTNKKTCEVAVHYSSPHVMQDFTFQCIDKVDPKTDQDRIEKI